MYPSRAAGCVCWLSLSLSLARTHTHTYRWVLALAEAARGIGAGAAIGSGGRGGAAGDTVSGGDGGGSSPEAAAAKRAEKSDSPPGARQLLGRCVCVPPTGVRRLGPSLQRPPPSHLHQFAVAGEGCGLRRLPRQRGDHGLAGVAEAPYD